MKSLNPPKRSCLIRLKPIRIKDPPDNIYTPRKNVKERDCFFILPTDEYVGPTFSTRIISDILPLAFLVVYFIFCFKIAVCIRERAMNNDMRCRYYIGMYDIYYYDYVYVCQPVYGMSFFRLATCACYVISVLCRLSDYTVCNFVC